jgi:Uma2 family endonuclease
MCETHWLCTSPVADASSAHAIGVVFEELRQMHMATRPKVWTLEELHSLPDDGNKYELVRGDLFVTPPPSETHEDVLARLHAILVPYVAEHGLGLVYRPRAVVRFGDSEVEPDLMVRLPRPTRASDWDDAPVPCLIVEVVSGSTRRRDTLQKRDLCLDAGVGEYWMIDPEARSVRVIRRGVADVVSFDEVSWSPSGAGRPLVIRVAEFITHG